MFYKRKHFLINRKFQLKFAFFVSSWIFALSMIYPILIYNIFEYFLHLIPSLGAQTPQLSVEKIRGVQGEVLFILGFLQLLVLIITFSISIFLSHRIAGPLYKLKNALTDVSKGEFDKKITFRKHDNFPELQDSFNEMVENLSIRRWR